VGSSPNVTVVDLLSDDAWARDTGPTFVVNRNARELRGVDWRFNIWGHDLPDWVLDPLVAEKILDVEGVGRFPCDIVMEGGSFHTDGEGTLITTEECLLNPNRNSNLSKQQIEDVLKIYLNVDKVIWLDKGVYRDLDTSGHVDNLCCFVAPGVVALTWTDDVHDPQYERSADAYARLSATTDAKGRSLKIHKIHQPNTVIVTDEEVDSMGEAPNKDEYYVREKGSRLPASYINFYIANGGIIVPGFGDEVHDKNAVQKLREIFPDRKVEQIYAREILLGGGNIHCITQQVPKV